MPAGARPARVEREVPRADSGSRRGDDGSRKPGGKSRLRKIVTALVVVAVALGIAYVVLSHTDVFEITSVEVEGSSRLSDTYLTSAVSVPKGTNLLDVDAGGVASRLTENPWVSSVSIKRSFPHTLVLQINENLPVAVVEVQPQSGGDQVQYWLLGSDATWMGQVTAEGVQAARQIVIDSTDDSTDDSATTDTSAETTETSDEETSASSQSGDSQGATTADESSQSSGTSKTQQEASICADVYYTATDLSKIPIITDTATGISPEVGAVETDSGITNALAIIEDSRGDFGEQIATITSVSGSSTGVVLKNGVEVSFGEATDMDTKISVVQDLLNQHEGQISYINVRVASRPAWRGTDE